MKLWRRHSVTAASADTGLLGRFGESCPICGAVLGESIAVDSRTGRFDVTPAIQLQVGAPDRAGRPSWRVGFVQGRFRRATSMTPAFSEREVDFVYLLCGGGHIFPDASPLYYARGTGDAQQRVDVWNMVAAIGAPASGKTYLLLRTLHQSLDNEENLAFHDTADRVQVRELSPLEKVPLSVRTEGYGHTLAEGYAIMSTNADAVGTPAGILSEYLPDAFAAVRSLIRRTVLGGAQRAKDWGRGSRQPLVLRTDARGRRSWTGVADLPGEMFADDQVNVRERSKLRAYDALIWVLDPVVAANATDWLFEGSLSAGAAKDLPGDAVFAHVLDGSMRPGSTAADGPAVVRPKREQVQQEIGRQLSLVEGSMAGDQGGALEMLVAITKCDLIAASLQVKDLEDLGSPGMVRRGATALLLLYAGRLAAQALKADQASTEILEFIWAGETARQSVREYRAEHFAESLLRHYSESDAFWNLVHHGRPERVPVYEQGVNRPRWEIQVPSTGDHLDVCATAGANTIFLRDLVMSAVGCGVAYGLGYENAVAGMLRNRWQNPRFFLCSPLTTVPFAGEDAVLTPLDPRARFPRAHERSAGLTHLMLAILEKVRQ